MGFDKAPGTGRDEGHYAEAVWLNWCAQSHSRQNSHGIIRNTDTPLKTGLESKPQRSSNSQVDSEGSENVTLKAKWGAAWGGDSLENWLLWCLWKSFNHYLAQLGRRQTTPKVNTFAGVVTLWITLIWWLVRCTFQSCQHFVVMNWRLLCHIRETLTHRWSQSDGILSSASWRVAVIVLGAHLRIYGSVLTSTLIFELWAHVCDCSESAEVVRCAGSQSGRIDNLWN